MKNIVIVLLMFFTTLATAQLSLSFNAGSNLYKTTIGFKMNKLIPYIGVEALHGNFTTTFEDYDDELYTSSTSMSVFMPTLGLKAFLIEKESIKAGANIGLFKPFVSGKIEEDGEEYEEFQEQLENFSSFGGEIGFFAEYFLSDQFSLGGEFGYRFANFKVSNPDDDDENIKLGIGGTFSSLSFNYYF